MKQKTIRYAGVSQEVIQKITIPIIIEVVTLEIFQLDSLYTNDREENFSRRADFFVPDFKKRHAMSLPVVIV